MSISGPRGNGQQRWGQSSDKGRTAIKGQSAARCGAGRLSAAPQPCEPCKPCRPRQPPRQPVPGCPAAPCRPPPRSPSPRNVAARAQSSAPSAQHPTPRAASQLGSQPRHPAAPGPRSSPLRPGTARPNAKTALSPLGPAAPLRPAPPPPPALTRAPLSAPPPRPSAPRSRPGPPHRSAGFPLARCDATRATPPLIQHNAEGGICTEPSDWRSVRRAGPLESEQ